MHAIVRALERYGVQLTPESLREIEDQIRRGRALLLARRERDAHYLVCHAGIIMRAVWLEDPGLIVTFLPMRDRVAPRPKPMAIRWRRRRQEREASHA